MIRKVSFDPVPRGMAGFLLGLCFSILVPLFDAAPALADGRVALVIANSDYGDMGRLKNPANDGRLLAKTLEGLGFAVDLVLDGDQRAMKRAIKNFGMKLRKSGLDGIGLFYYAGHGLQVGGENYLIPIGAQIESEGDVEIEAVAAGSILSQMQYAGNAVNLVFLDACRNNPLTRGFRSVEKGLARVEAPRGSFVGYSTAPGEVATDGDGENSPYALALAEELGKPGISVDTAHRNVRSKVLTETHEMQTPWDSSSLIGEVVLAAATPEVATAAPAVAAPGTGSDKEALFWESIKDSQDPEEFAAYLEQYPNGTFARLAHGKMAKLSNAGAPSIEQSTAPAPEPPADRVVELDATYVARQSANIRSEPSTLAKIIGRLKEDDAVTVTGKVQDKDWYRVSLAKDTGYVSSQLLVEADADEIAAWGEVKRKPSAEAVQAFLQAHPGSYFKPKAEALLAALATPAPAPAPLSAPAEATQPPEETAAAAAPEREGAKPGTIIRDCSDCPEMVVVPAGSFTMGSPPSEAGRADNENAQHRVTIGKPFAVGKFEVTLTQFQKFVQASGYRPTDYCWTDPDGDGTWYNLAWYNWAGPGFAGYTQGANDPVVCVTWRDAEAYAAWLSNKTGKTYRLLTEAEWEYAARAGKQTPFPWGSDLSGVCTGTNGADTRILQRFPSWSGAPCDDGYAYTAPAGSYPANGFGLYDMVGNVMEWVEDCYRDNYNNTPVDGSAVGGNCQSRVIRGGAWNVKTSDLRFADRSAYTPDGATISFGFRVARDLN
ncbi:MAG: SUMF1/EgtB/PvdO family nonheme iron enzyme [Proteobacteria bacterium]|nr:SUMF1/EgtB/PvdO family nonheme iron enzyme [Pseudomonadota bacterium]